MNAHRYVLLLGSGTDDEGQLRRARDRLKQRGRILARSGVEHSPSVVPGDPARYVNQALLFACDAPRDAFAPWLKALEQALGRTAGGPCVIDIDLVAECDGHGDTLWQNDAKLEHALFRELVSRVVRR